jgi:hypothetical protein
MADKSTKSKSFEDLNAMICEHLALKPMVSEDCLALMRLRLGELPHVLDSKYLLSKSDGKAVEIVETAPCSDISHDLDGQVVALTQVEHLYRKLVVWEEIALFRQTAGKSLAAQDLLPGEALKECETVYSPTCALWKLMHRLREAMAPYYTSLEDLKKPMADSADLIAQLKPRHKRSSLKKRSHKMETEEELYNNALKRVCV